MIAFIAKKILATLILPPAGPLLLAALGLLLLRRWPRLGRTLAWGGIVFLWLISTPLIAQALLHTLETAPPLDMAQDMARVRRAQAIVVLGGGNYLVAPEYGGDTVGRITLERVRYAARLARETGLPLLVTGGAPQGGTPEGQTMRAALEHDFGVPVRWVEDRSLDTRENALYSAAILRAAGVDRVLLVTYAFHMPRSLAAFADTGLEIIPAPTAYATLSPFKLTQLLPTERGLEQGYFALHEWLGLVAQKLTR